MAKKYYWLKLKEDFFGNREIKKLRRIAGGDTYTLIYLKLMLLSLKNDGGLIFEGTENDLAEQLSLEIDEDIDNVQVTLNFMFANNLICETENADKYTLPYAMACIGGESESAVRVRQLRSRKALQCSGKALQCNGDVTNCNTEIEIELRDRDRVKSIEYRDKKERDIEKEKNTNPQSQKPLRHKYGEYDNVLLSDEDLDKLKAEFPDDWMKRIENLSGYIASTGKSYKNHLATIRNWARNEKDRKRLAEEKVEETRTDNMPPGLDYDAIIIGGL